MKNKMIPKIFLSGSPTSGSYAQTSLLSQSPNNDSFNDSPPTSPALPYPNSHYPQKPVRLWRRKSVRLFCWIFGIFIVGWFAWPYLYPDNASSMMSASSETATYTQDGDEYEMVGGDELPEEPLPVIVTDSEGQPRWTVSIPPKKDFPLAPAEYTTICTQTGSVAQHVTLMTEEPEKLARRRHQSHKHYGYYYEDPNYMDVGEAVESGLIPGLDEEDDGEGEICDKSITFVLQTDDAGFGRTLLRLWMSYGLAQKEGRAFFVDDTNWAYGSYTSYFQPPPTQTCRQPPRNQIVPCPHQARHLMISSASTTWAFGHTFTDEYEDSHSMGVERQEPIFSLLRTGYEALFILSDQDARYYTKRINALNSTVRAQGGIEVGVHVRHGDIHPREFLYQKSYIPLEKYVTAAKDIIAVAFGKEGKYHRETPEELKSKMIVASDDPEVYSSEEFSNAEKAQYQISLASKSALDAVSVSHGSSSSSKGSKNIGWEGGFFKDIFWSLGAPSTFGRGSGGPNPSKRSKPEPEPPILPPVSHPHSPRQMPEQTAHSVNLAEVWKAAEQNFHFHPTAEALKLRELVGRGYLLDLAVLAQTDKVICGINTAGCRILAVMMGWERGIVEEGWNNIDGSWHWKGIIW
ncbi:hypothetical protein FQN54_000642 [Arachnomyces sp. PD_36]|nr:hypothetical protein FQN54_000642 [Arachnomyces sp. PD_36]